MNGLLERLGFPVRLCTRVRMCAKYVYTSRENSVAVHGVAVEATSVVVSAAKATVVVVVG